jgi:thiamine kinase
MAGELSAATAVGDIGQITALCRHLEFFAGHPVLSVAPLSNGELNLNYRVETCRGLYAVRRYPASSSGVCRQQELRCQHAAAVAGIAPAPLCLNNHLQVLISEFIQGGARFVVTGQTVPILAATLAKLHQLRTRTPVLQPVNYLQQLATHIGQFPVTGEVQLLARLLAVAENHQKLSNDMVLCHLDLHSGNMLWADKKLWLLDFEYAQTADSCLDLAAVSLHFQLSEPLEQQLLAAYQQCRAGGVSQHTELLTKFALAKIVFSGFCWLWYLSLQQKLDTCRQQTQYWQQQLTQQLTQQLALQTA